MLFSLVLAVASKEVELWQTFDDFAPRHLMDDAEEQENDGQEQEYDGEEDQLPMETEPTEGGLAQYAVPALAVAGVAVLGGLYWKKQQNKEGGKDDGATAEKLIKNLKEGEPKTVGLAAAGTLGLGAILYSLVGGSSTGGVQNAEGLEKFLTKQNVAIGSTVGAVGTFGAAHQGWFGEKFQSWAKFYQKKPETTGDASKKDEPAKDEPAGDASKKDEPAEKAPKKDEPAKDEPATQDS